MIEAKFYLNKESCQKSANHCNLKKDAAKLAQEQSNHLYLSVLLQSLAESKGMVLRDAIVVQVLDTAFDVMMPEYGLEKRIHLDQLPLERYSWNETTETLKLYWGAQAFLASDDEGTKASESASYSRQSVTLSRGGFDTMDHPDDATNAYDDERGLFDDESDYEDVDESLTLGMSKTNQGGDEGDEQAENLSKIKTFGHVQVLITADMAVSPPVIKVVAMNPFAAPPSSSSI